mmetsp:Transcript_3161/g.6569  ORF Transcript_3161/g.6569 Transcript_3161/m.6569 type:complete len:202 (-) Transcript_3161:492-1097(-)
MVAIAATLSCSLISSALIWALLSVEKALPTCRNSVPKIWTASARRNLDSLGTEASSKSFLQTSLRVVWISRLLMASANSKKVGSESSMASCISMASFICSSSDNSVTLFFFSSPPSAAVGAESSPPEAAASRFFCISSAWCMVLTPALAALIPAPSNPRVEPNPLALALVLAKCPCRPKKDFPKPRYSSALTSNENPMIFR